MFQMKRGKRLMTCLMVTGLAGYLSYLPSQAVADSTRAGGFSLPQQSDGVTVYGVVRHRGGGLASGAIVKMAFKTSSGRDGVVYVTANARGAFKVADLPSGSFTITAVHRGMAGQFKSRVNPGSQLGVQITLNAER